MPFIGKCVISNPTQKISTECLPWVQLYVVGLPRWTPQARLLPAQSLYSHSRRSEVNIRCKIRVVFQFYKLNEKRKMILKPKVTGGGPLKRFIKVLQGQWVPSGGLRMRESRRECHSPRRWVLLTWGRTTAAARGLTWQHSVPVLAALIPLSVGSGRD